MSYADFLTRKQRLWTGLGHDGLADLNPMLHDWQRALVTWALRKGRAALFCDTGLGKTFMQVSWANALGCRVLFFAPLCVAEQTVAEAAKLGIAMVYARNQVEANGARLVITNYERLEDFNIDEFGGVVLDESSILKAFTSKTRGRLIAACQNVRYRLCCTATPSPNDIQELGNHAEFLGLMTRTEFLATWFIHDDAGWRMKKHAVQSFYRWLASWAVAIRLPSDIGYADGGYVLPNLQVTDHILPVDGPTGNTLFPEMSTKGLTGRMDARRGSLDARTEKAVNIMRGKPHCQWLAWCGLNDEAEAIVASQPDIVNVEGSDSYEHKTWAVQSFVLGETRRLLSKVRILGFGMNFQNCHHMVFVGINDSFEQFYQAVRRCWRFGQKHPVDVHVVISEAEQVVVENVRRKEAAAMDLSRELVSHMADFEREELSA